MDAKLESAPCIVAIVGVLDKGDTELPRLAFCGVISSNCTAGSILGCHGNLIIRPRLDAARPDGFISGFGDNAEAVKGAPWTLNITALGALRQPAHTQPTSVSDQAVPAITRVSLGSLYFLSNLEESWTSSIQSGCSRCAKRIV